MKIRHYFPLFAILCGVLLLTGCGSSGGSGGDQTASPVDDLGSDAVTGIDYVGADTCIGCHEDFSWSAEIVAKYLDGKHVVNYAGSYGYDYMVANDCDSCHDPVGDSPALSELLGAERVTMGCENCHGAGGDHYGVGPMPVANPDYTTCVTCHDALPDSHLSHHPEANNIGTNFVASRHFTASVRNEAICAKCHTDAGGKLYKDVTTREQLLATVLPVSSDAAVQCRTCHDPHNAGGLLFADVEDHGEVVESGEYATCVSCHMGDNAAVADDGAGGTDWDATEVIYHQDVYYRIITDTHSDDPATTDTIEGYVIDPLSDRACRDCHDVHAVEEIRADDDSSSFSNTINDQWAKSGHAGQIGTVKLAVAEDYGDNMGLNRTTEQTVAIKEAGVTSVTGDAWVHYDWDASDRQECQECHTSTGAKNYLTDPASYDYTANDFSHLSGWANDAGVITSSGQNELLYCWGCHSDNNGGLRNPGAISRPYTVDSVAVTLPDVGNSNVCINCHGARGNMDSYEIGATDEALTGDPTTDMSGLKPGFGLNTENVTEAHYLVASATLFQEQTRIGYEYPVVILEDGVAIDPYADVSYFAHNSIGLNSDAPETGNGPCAACHMESDEGHTFNVVEKVAGVITALKSTSCVECHSGAHGAALVTEDTTIDGVLHTAAAAAAFLEEEAEGFHGALALLEAELIADGLTFTGGYPYFSGASWTNEGNFGAAHNYNYLHHEPGAYAHNRMYAKRLIFDSIDWLQNGALTGTIDVSTATAEGAAWLGATRP